MSETDAGRGGANRLLKGWKEIGAHFGRDETTVRRWAAGTGLPVHRVPGRQRAPVYAYAGELDAWLKSRRELGADEDLAPVSDALQPAPGTKPLPEDAAAPQVPGPGPAFARVRPAVMGLGAAACVTVVLVMMAVGLWRSGPAAPRQQVAYQPRGGAEALYLDGLYNLETRTADGLTRAIGLFTQALREDPDYAQAHVGLADAYNLVSQYTAVPPGEVYPKARAVAERAIALDPDNSGAYAALAFNTYYWQENLPGAVRLFEKAIALDPSNARARHWYALVAMQDRRFDVAVREISEAQRLDPQSPSILANKGLILFHAGRVDEALAVLRPLAVTNPSLRSAAAYLATIYLATARDEEFLAEFRRSAILSGSREDLAIADAAEAGFKSGRRPGMLLAMMGVQERLYREGRLPAFRLALTAAMLGKRQSAFDYLARSIQRREPEIKGIRLEPALAGLHTDARFNVMIAEAGLSPANDLPHETENH
ncbi:tetratricopeptide repeat protein [Shinella sp. BYT-45]|uniref:tetratricopeptide repeat protein n=1 Tax=Shinella sp. BYT-45 TaxID=3377377 RepID=UPI003980C70D